MEIAMICRFLNHRAGVSVAACVLLLTVWTPVSAQSDGAAAAPLTLAGTVELATRSAPLLGALDARQQAASEELLRAGALPDPELMLGIDNLTATGNDAFAIGADPMTMRKIGFRQRLPAPAKREAERRMALAERDLRTAQLQVGTLTVGRVSGEAWVLRWAAEHERALLQALLADTRLATRAARARVSAGGNPGDVLAVRALELEIENQLSSSEAGIASANASLQRWLGEQALRPLAMAPDFADPPLPEARALVLLDRTADLLEFAAHDARADAAVSAARAQRRPDFSIAAGYGQRAASRADMISLEFAIDLPLFTANRQDRGIAASIATRDALHAEHEDARRAAVAAIRADYAQWAALVAQTQRDQRERLPLLHDRSALALASYRSGQSLDGWIDARRDEVQASIETTRRLQALGNAWVGLAYRFQAQELQP